MRTYFTIIITIFSLFVCSCTNPTMKTSTQEPIPPDPFPILLTTHLSTFEVHMTRNLATLKLQSIIQINTPMKENTVLTYQIFNITGTKQEQLQTKVLLNTSLELYVKKQLVEDISLSQYGE